MDRYQLAFSGVRRLYGADGQERLRRARVCVIGVGGVGSWAVEALARSGVGALTLVDMDDICMSNTNRQLHAIEGEFHKAKVDSLAARARAINPECQARPVREFFTAANARRLLAPRFDFVFDAMDAVREKALCVALCREMGVPVVTSGGAGGRRDPARVRVDDLARVTHDRLLQSLRKTLRAEHGFPRGERKFGVEAVCSSEPPVFPQSDGRVCATREGGADLRLDCRSGLGTAAFVTGAFGFVAAARIVERISSSPSNDNPQDNPEQ